MYCMAIFIHSIAHELFSVKNYNISVKCVKLPDYLIDTFYSLDSNLSNVSCIWCCFLVLFSFAYEL